MWPPAFFGDRPRGRNPFANGSRGLTVVDGERTRPRRVHLDAQVDPIQQRPGQLAEISPLGHRRADAIFRICWGTRARVSGQHQLEACRVARDAIAAGEPNLTLLQRSSQCFHGADPDLSTLIEEQHSPVRTADRSRDRFPTVGAFARAFETAAASPLPGSAAPGGVRSRLGVCSASRRRSRRWRRRESDHSVRDAGFGCGPSASPFRWRPARRIWCTRTEASPPSERPPLMFRWARRPPSRSRRSGQPDAPSTRRARRADPRARAVCEVVFAIN